MKIPGQLPVACFLLLCGCLVPLPLEQENPTDGGLQLFVDRADPPFGTQQASQRGQYFNYQVYAKTDSPNLAGRLCVQVNETCCVLQPSDSAATRCLLNANVIPIGQPGSSSFELSFGQFAPCAQDPRINRAYIVPVLATGGFDDSGGIIGVNGLGKVDQSHFWEVRCP